MSGNEFDPLDLDATFDVDDSELWKAENPGDKVSGTLVDVEVKPGKFHKDRPFPWLSIDTGLGVVKVPASSYGLQRKLKAAMAPHGSKIRLGYEISIEYVGETPTASGNFAKDYEVTYGPKAGA